MFQKHLKNAGGVVLALMALSMGQAFLITKLPQGTVSRALKLSASDADYIIQFKVPNEVANLVKGVGSTAESLQSQIAHSIPGFNFESLFGGAQALPLGSEASAFFLPSILAMGLLGVGWIKMMSEKSSPFNESFATYEPQKMEEFYKQRPWLVFGRLARIMWLTASFNVNLLLDWKFNSLQKNEKDRAKQATHLLSNLGPTFVKLGQALSIRTDLISPTYASELKALQDSVPPFDDALAKSIICKELGITHLNEKFRTISDKPVASASIGQVYKAVLHNGREVAVKVQRPDILPSIGLDLFILRLIAPLQVKLTNLVNGAPTTPSDLELGYSLVDEWGRGLVGEVDYKLEAQNTRQFIEAMKKRGLDAVTAPDVVPELSTSKVLVTQWVYGTRLDRDASKDVPRLCGLALNAYLTMLLDTGVLHCDPHPGNLLRTTDGKLCILDWGMTLSLPADLQYALLEFIAHVNAADFSELPEDFVKLGATPAGKVDEVRASGIPEGFAFIMTQLSKGGGPKQITENLRTEFKARYGDLSDMELTRKATEDMISRRELREIAVPTDVNGMAGLMEMMSKKNRAIFRIPSYMLYIVRAFSTLEGIGLSIDPNYSILTECYPYLAQRLMTDSSPRSKAALRNMLYKDGRLKTDKLVEFSDGFTSYTASTAHVEQGEGIKKAQAALTDLILDGDGNTMQDLLLEGAAKMADSIVRVGLDQVKGSPGGQLIKLALQTPKAIVDNLLPSQLKPLMLPFTLPYDISKALINLVETDERDLENVKSLRILLSNMEPRMRQQLREIVVNTLDEADNQSRGSMVIPLSLMDSRAIRKRLGQARKFNDRLPVMLRLTRKLGANVFSTVSERMGEVAQGGGHDHQSVPAAQPAIPVGKEQVTDLDYEVELLLTEQIGTLSSVTAKGLARVLDLNSMRNK